MQQLVMQNLIDEIVRLSQSDNKTLSQKITKTVTEVGELASVGLAIERAPGSIHRVVTRDSLLEECCDVMLCALSIPLSSGFTMDDVVAKLHEKTAKWSMLESNANGVKYPLPYELHVSVDIKYLESARIICADNGFKLTVIKLDHDSAPFDAMTSCIHYGDNSSATKELERISGVLRAGGVHVIREKIESAPWHPLAPLGSVMPEGCYWEAHIGVELNGGPTNTYAEQRASLDRVAGSCSGKISFNDKKIFSATHQVVMMSLRSYVMNRDQFDELVASALKGLSDAGLVHFKPAIEFAIHDTNPQHDYKW